MKADLMWNIEIIESLMSNLESDRIERTTSFREDKMGPVVCAFANDFPNYRQSGYILLGVTDTGQVAGISIGDEDLQKNDNVVIAEALKILGFVNRFNFGVNRAKDELVKNGNGEPEFDLSLITKFKVTIPLNHHW